MFLGTLAMVCLVFAAFVVYLFVLPTSIQVYAPLLDGPATPSPKPSAAVTHIEHRQTRTRSAALDYV